MRYLSLALALLAFFGSAVATVENMSLLEDPAAPALATAASGTGSANPMSNPNKGPDLEVYHPTTNLHPKHSVSEDLVPMFRYWYVSRGHARARRRRLSSGFSPIRLASFPPLRAPRRAAPPLCHAAPRTDRTRCAGHARAMSLLPSTR